MFTGLGQDISGVANRIPAEGSEFIAARGGLEGDWRVRVETGFSCSYSISSGTRTRPRNTLVEYEYHFIEYEYDSRTPNVSVKQDTPRSRVGLGWTGFNKSWR